MTLYQRGKTSIFALTFILLLGAFLAYLNFPQSEEKSQKRPQGDRAVSVKSTILTKSLFTDVINSIGTAKANESVTITASTSDYISKVYFNDGQYINTGQHLVLLRSDEEQAKVRELEINIDEAKRQLKRLTDLSKENATSESLLGEQQAKVKTLQAQLIVAKTKLQEMTITAPFAGRLGFRNVSTGTYVTPGTVITTLDDIKTVKVDFSLPEKHLPLLKLNQLVSTKVDAYKNKTFDGKISSIDSRVDPITRSITVRAMIDNQSLELRPGMLLTLAVEKSSQQTLLIDERALIPQQNKQFVFVVGKDSTVQKVEVTVGRRTPGKAEILSGVNEGDHIVIEGGLKLRHGSKVKETGEE